MRKANSVLGKNSLFQAKVKKMAKQKRDSRGDFVGGYQQGFGMAAE